MAGDSVSTHHVRLAADTAAYQKGMRTAAASTSVLASAQQKGANTSRVMGVRMQMAGYQVQDFFVQVASGQSAMRAFIQQGTQMLGVFGPAGALAGAALAIGGVAIQMGKGGDKAREMSGEVKSLEQALRERQAVARDVHLGGLTNEAQSALIEGEVATIHDQMRVAAEEFMALERAVENAKAETREFGRIGGASAELALRNQAKAEKALADAIEPFQAKILQLQEQVLKKGEELARVQGKVAEALEGQKTMLEKIDWAAPINEARDATSALIAEGERLKRSVMTADELSESKLMNYRFLHDSGAIDDETLRRLQDQLAGVENLHGAFVQLGDGINRVMADIANSSSDAFATMVLSGENAFKSLADAAARAVLQMTFQFSLLNPILNGLFGGVKGFEPLPALWSLGPNKASGGGVAAGQAYRWQEAGNEYFVPNMDGKVVRESDMAGDGVVIHQTNNFQSGITRSEIAQLLPGIVNATKAAVFEARLRGGAFARA